MTVSIRPFVEAFYRASAERDIERAVSLIDENVNWMLQGPVDVFAFFGQRCGKDAVVEGYREVARQLNVTGYEVESLLVDGDRAAALVRLTSIVRRTGRTMSVRTSQFSRWSDGKIVHMRAVCDSYDLVEQTLDRSLSGQAADSDLIFA